MNATLYVPESSVESYELAAPWSNFGTIKAMTPSAIQSINGTGNNANQQVGPRKYMEGGRLIIKRGDKEYDAAGKQVR